MSTRSSIAFKSKDGKFLTCYCHCDGYPGHVGKLVTSHYNTKEKMLELLSYGSIMALASTIKESDFFARDHEESLEQNKPQYIRNVEDLLRFYNFVDYVYILDENSKMVTTYKVTWAEDKVTWKEI